MRDVFFEIWEESKVWYCSTLSFLAGASSMAYFIAEMSKRL